MIYVSRGPLGLFIRLISIYALLWQTNGFLAVRQSSPWKEISFALLQSSTQGDYAADSSVGVAIEYCTGCRWGLRSFWMAQELLSTFQDDISTTPLTVTLMPTNLSPGGQFRVHFYTSSSSEEYRLLWDRKEKGRFPDIKELKQFVRDEINPDLFLGHADSEDRRKEKEEGALADTFLKEKQLDPRKESARLWIRNDIPQPHVAIRYCIGCKWLLRAAYFGQELLSTFSNDEIKSLSLQPSTNGGEFTVYLKKGKDEEPVLLWDRSSQGGFPPVPELKQRVRDQLAPSKDLGHSDAKTKA